jgi:hypothetical protein
MKIRSSLLVATTAVLAALAIAVAPTLPGRAAALPVEAVAALPVGPLAAPSPEPFAAQLQTDPSIAPRDTWSCLGGSLSRTRFTDTRAVLQGPLEMRFDIEPMGELEGEPLLDADRIVTVSVDSSGKRRLEVFGLENGLRIGEAKELAATEPVHACMVDGEIAVRSAAGQIEVYSIGKNGLRRSRNLKAPAGSTFGHPILLGDDVIVALGDSIVRYGPKGAKPVWTAEGAFRGHLTLVGTTLYALEYDTGSGAAKLAKIDAETGAIAERRNVGRRQGGAPALPGDDLVAVHGKFAVVFGSAKFALETGISSLSAAFDLTREPGSGSALTGSTFMSHPPAIFARGWMGFYEHPIDGRSIQAMLASAPGQNPTQPVRLASQGWHEELLRFRQAPAFARGVTYFAGLAWDAGTSRILWRDKRLEGADLLPARDSVLAIRSKRTIEIWRRVRPVQDDAGIVARVAPATAEEGLLLLRDGDLERGKFMLSGEGKSLEVMKVGDAASRGWRARDVAFAGLLDGTVLYAADRDQLADGIDAVARERQVAIAEKACGQAEKSGDPGTMVRVFGLANELGVEEKALDKLEKAMEKARDGTPKVSEKSVEAAKESLAEIKSVRAEIAYRALESLWVDPAERLSSEEAEETDRFAADATRRVPRHVYQLLALVLEADHDHESAREKLALLLPEDVDLPEGRRVVDWTTFAEFNAYYPVELHFPPRDYKGELSWEQEKLDNATANWRDDIIGYRTEKLFVISPVESAGAIARCLALSEQLCRILESMYVGGSHERNTFDPLVVYLYGTREEYLKQSGPGLEWTAGHYNLQTQISRLYVSGDDEDVWGEVTEVLMHELTHHWLDVRNPRIPEETNQERIGTQKGYWIVEGFASLLQYFKPDPFTGEYTTLDPRGDRIDNVANARDDQLLPWKVLFRREHVNLLGLEGHSFDALPLTWSLGSLTTPGGVGLFYAQSAVVCMYLYHGEGGRYRGQLYDYVVNYYTGNADMLPIDAAFGMSEEELGKRAAEFARKVVKDSLNVR